MINDISKLNSISVWLSRNSHDYLFFVEFRDIEKIYLPYVNSSKFDLVQNVIDNIEQVKNEGTWNSYLICWEYDKKYFFQSDNSFFSSIYSNINLIERKEILIQRGLFHSLSLKEKQVFRLLAEGFTQDVICRKLKIKLGTLKCHRNHIYSKMGFSSKTDLLIWCKKYQDCIYEQHV